MNTRRATLLEVLYPRCFTSNPKRAEATKTIIQPDTDAFEQAEAALLEGCQSESSAAQNASSRACVARYPS